ncbi:EpsG family protein [Aerococcus viridans]|uniref:EpsG family protein n=1 Tax=Aerococcus viridans TaxID=1377 RepID=UPI002DB7A8DF|nr:EpsG family protein [Aerococcus viridans]MEB7389004.1 EpsG family protein [Aerococcus viridans]
MNRGLTTIVLFLFLFILSAFRSDSIGTDTQNYIQTFKIISTAASLNFESFDMEAGYLFFNKILAILFNNPQWLLITTSAIVFTGVGIIVYRYSKNIWMSTFLFFGLNFFTSSMNTTRTFLSLVILLFSIQFIFKNDFFKFLIVVMVATTFHQSAIIFIIAWFISKIKLNKFTLLIFTSLNLLIFLFLPLLLRLIVIVFPTYLNYLSSSFYEDGVKLASVINFSINLLIFIIIYLLYNSSYVNRELMRPEDINIFNKSLNILLIGVSLSFLAIRFSLLTRVSYYFMIMSILLLPNVTKLIKKRNLRMALMFTIIFIFFMYTMMVNAIRPEWDSIYPYKFFWNN